ncbi:MAG: hypothetical protein IJK31_03125 [Ruminococcus sp.]|nr:hypothetical protein [Ruminococcus sp.]
MKSFFANVWTKRVVALISLFYAFMVCRLCYFSIFYDIHIHARVQQCLTITSVSIVVLLIMLYTRKQIITRIASFLILPAMLPVVLLYFGEWGMIIPIILTGVAILLLSGAGEGAKTALGTITLLLYIFGALGYFLFASFFVTATKQEVIEDGVSPSGRYRYRVVNTEDSSKDEGPSGSTAVYVEPNYADKKYSFATFTLKNMERVVHLNRPICEDINIEWKTQSRQEITQELNAISDTISIHLSEDDLEYLGYSYDEKLRLEDIAVSMRFKIDRTASDVDPIYLNDLTDDQLAIFGIGRDSDSRYYILSPTNAVYDAAKVKGNKRLYFSDLNSKALKAFNNSNTDDFGNQLFNVKKDNTVYLNTLSDEQLDKLGVPETGDVMYFNGKVCFRYYVAELEDYFDVDSRHISIDLLN